MTPSRASRTKMPTPVWMRVQRRRGLAGPPAAIARIQAAKTTGSTRRSNFRSIGVETESSISLNGTSHNTAMKAASNQGSSRVVRGQSPMPSDRAAPTGPGGGVSSAEARSPPERGARGVAGRRQRVPAQPQSEQQEAPRDPEHHEEGEAGDLHGRAAVDDATARLADALERDELGRVRARPGGPPAHARP